MAMVEAEKPADCRIHIRGETTNLGDPAPRGVLQVIALSDLPPIPKEESGRRQLAMWLASEKNPLPARVAVNRIWMHLFGRGIVTTIDDFGATGAAPSHPALLDYLAATFIENGWSTKQLIRSIVLSRVYQLDSAVAPEQAAQLEIDPDNQWLWRFRPRRLEVEAFRDATLQVAGRLDRSRPESFLSPWSPYERHVLTDFKPFVTPDQLENPHRSVYFPVIREALPEIYSLFDFADPNRVVGQRNESTLPSQALFLMNSPWLIERSTWTVARLHEAVDDDESRLNLLYRLAFGRAPLQEELEFGLAYLASPEVAPPQAAPDKESDEVVYPTRWVSYCQMIFASTEFRYLQ